MKKSLRIILALCLLAQIAYSQEDYIPFVENDKYWFYAHLDGADANPGAYGIYVIYFLNDTIIEGQDYHHVMKSWLAGTHPCQFPPCFTANLPYEFLDTTVIGYIREDLVERKVYFLPKNPNGETCEDAEKELYDFSAQVGDRISECAIYSMDERWGESLDTFCIIDSVKQVNKYGRERRTVHFQAPYLNTGLGYISNMAIYEGVGLDYYEPYFFSLYDVFGDICQGSLAGCNILNSTNEAYHQSPISIAPNPTRDYLYIDAPYSRVDILDQRGQLIETHNAHQISVQNLSAGIYFIRIHNKTKESYYSKFVKID